MPSSEDIIVARNEVTKWAVEQMVKEGHPINSAIEIVQRMSLDERVEKAEKVHGPIYRGAYSPY